MNAIFAVDSTGGFGSGSGMPWPRNNADLRRFKELTLGSTVVMGRSTWCSDMPKPLPGRRNCVLSSALEDSRCDVYRSVQHLMLNLGQTEEVYVIGGTGVLWTLRPYITTVYLTRFNFTGNADVFLDTDEYLDGFTCDSTSVLDDHTFEIWRKRV